MLDGSIASWDASVTFGLSGRMGGTNTGDRRRSTFRWRALGQRGAMAECWRRGKSAKRSTAVEPQSGLCGNVRQ
jgi:hypothetical protein